MNIADFKQDPQVFHFLKLECSLKVFLHMKRTYIFLGKLALQETEKCFTHN